MLLEEEEKADLFRDMAAAVRDGDFHKELATQAAQAALLVLNLDYSMYDTVSSILVHPSTQTLRGPRGTGMRRPPVAGSGSDE